MRAQSEILGVVVVVILLVVGGLIMVRMSLNRETTSSSSYVDPEQAQSFLNALMNTKTKRNIIVEDVIKDCANDRHYLCPNDNCCQYAEDTINNALDATLKEWGRDYRLSITRDGTELISPIVNNDCDRFREQFQPGVYYIPPPPAIIARLEICRS